MILRSIKVIQEILFSIYFSILFIINSISIVIKFMKNLDLFDNTYKAVNIRGI